MARFKSRNPDPAVQTARWSFRSLVLCITLGTHGVRTIEPIQTERAGQLYLWPDVVEPLPNLETVEPFGKCLAEELFMAFTGRPFTPQVPWCAQEPVWHAHFYRYLLTLPPGRITRLAGVLFFEGMRIEEKAWIRVLRSCRLAPLVPLQRVGLPERMTLRFSLGKFWKTFLLGKEKAGAIINQSATA